MRTRDGRRSWAAWSIFTSCMRAIEMDETGSAFQDVPHSARGHLGLLFYAAAYHLIYHLRCRAAEVGGTMDQVLHDFPFLNNYFVRIRERLPADIEWLESLEWLRA